MQGFRAVVEIELPSGKREDVGAKAALRGNNISDALGLGVELACKAMYKVKRKTAYVSVYKECEKCGGAGKISNEPLDAPLTATCPKCEGSGLGAYIVKYIKVSVGDGFEIDEGSIK